MRKAFIVSHASQRETLLKRLRSLGAVHLEPVSPDALAPKELRHALSGVQRARQALSGYEPQGPKPEMPARDAADEVLTIVHRKEERHQNLNALHREAAALEIWGEVRIEQFRTLDEAGVKVFFYNVPNDDVAAIEAELVWTLKAIDKKRAMVAAVVRDGEPKVPESALVMERPARDMPTVRHEAKTLAEAGERDEARLAELAHLDDALADEERRLKIENEFAHAEAGALAGGDLFGVQGWVPAEAADGLQGHLSKAGLPAAVGVREPKDDEHPPTLVRYPRWAKPIKGLFDILGTSPGYREFDVSPFFMVAMPLFAAFLIGDFGYGLIFFLLGALGYRKFAPTAGPQKMQLLIIVGLATMVWGMLAATYFGFTPDGIAAIKGVEVETLFASEGFWPSVARTMASVAPLWGDDESATQFLLTQVAFIMGAIHLTLAQLRRAVFLGWRQQTLSHIGWSLFIWGMLGVIWELFPYGTVLIPMNGIVALLIGGGVLIVGFTYPDRNPLKRIGIGLASSLLPAIGAFGDTISYIRLMAVGLATLYIGAAFNTLAFDLAATATWFAGAPLMVIGHALNIALAVIALFAHGVRLNMLEFSNNAGIEWSGYPYEPFSAEHLKES